MKTIKIEKCSLGFLLQLLVHTWISTEAWSHAMVCVGRSIEDHLASIPAAMDRDLSQGQVVQSSIQPSLGCVSIMKGY